MFKMNTKINKLKTDLALTSIQLKPISLRSSNLASLSAAVVESERMDQEMKNLYLSTWNQISEGWNTNLLYHFIHLGANGWVEDLGICSHQVDQKTQIPLFFARETQRTHVALLQSLWLNDPTTKTETRMFSLGW